MAVMLRVDLANATFADLEAVVAAARVAGASTTTQVALDGSDLVVSVEGPATSSHPASAPTPSEAQPQPPARGQEVGADAALKFIAHLLGENRS
ncbi:hypothetical protein [Corynebacterium uterequi]|uniref:Uncharacterized protein n=1 Tax=Corynebacterium uterequi TaxID=1072256 RepID=A0A0G3HK57_9CORY|nr:hypothetical protein [Corynebacterium uterequi]AKK11537.1 hypothetical protein CUTER_07740 [Corynebacterium uterequi]